MESINNSGIHTIEEFDVIFFQIFVCYYSMIECDYIKINNNSSFNYYIAITEKDQNSMIYYWKYVIDKINFFIPNYGYMFMFDPLYNKISNNCDYIREINVDLQIILYIR